MMRISPYLCMIPWIQELGIRVPASRHTYRSFWAPGEAGSRHALGLEMWRPFRPFWGMDRYILLMDATTPFVHTIRDKVDPGDIQGGDPFWAL